MNPAAPKLATFLILWFGFLNTQLILGLASFFLWKMAHPGAVAGSAVYFDPGALQTPLGMAVVGFAAIQSALAWWLPSRIFHSRRTPPPVSGLPSERISVEDARLLSQPFVLRLVFLEAPALFALAWAQATGNSLLALPFLAFAAVQTAVCFPSEPNLRRMFGIV